MLNILWGTRVQRVIFSMGHTGVSRKSPSDSHRETSNQIDSIGQFLHHSSSHIMHHDRETVFSPHIVFKDMNYANFRIHKFEWHGQDKDEDDHMIRSARKITQLPMMPEHFADKINEVRTIDDIQMVIRFVVYYELVDVLKMVRFLHPSVSVIQTAQELCIDIFRFRYRMSVDQCDSIIASDPHARVYLIHCFGMVSNFVLMLFFSSKRLLIPLLI